MKNVKIKIEIDLENADQVAALNNFFKVVGGSGPGAVKVAAKEVEPSKPKAQVAEKVVEKPTEKQPEKDVEPAQIVSTNKAVTVEELRAEVKNTKNLVTDEDFKKCREELTRIGETSVANLSADQRFEFMKFLLNLQGTPLPF